MKRGLILTAIIAGISGCQLAEPPHHRYYENVRAERSQPQEEKPTPIEETFFAQCHDNEYDFDSRCIDFTQGYIATAKESVYLFNMEADAGSIDTAGATMDGICSSYKR